MFGFSALNAARNLFRPRRRRIGRRNSIGRLTALLLAVVVAVATAGQVSAAPAKASGAPMAMTGGTGTGTGGAFNPSASH